jgi:hypothetical protein
MRYLIAAIGILFMWAGYANIRKGDDQGGKKLPVPRRMLGIVQVVISILLGGVALALFSSTGGD